MSEIRCLIVDDEPLARRGLRQLLERHADVRIVGEARDGRDALQLIRATRPDLLFLDVQMPELDGFGVVELGIVGSVPAVVFVTAYDEFAVDAFAVDAVDYLVKPLVRERFEAALRRVRDRLAWLRSRPEQTPGTEATGVLRVHTRRGDLLLRFDEIDWIEAADYYAVVHAAGARHLIRDSLATMARRLPAAQFLRVHRSAIVNIARIRAFEAVTGGGHVVLRTGARVPVSRRSRAALEKRLAELSGS